MPRGFTDKVIERMAQAYYIIESRGCATTATVMAELGLNHTKAYYALDMLRMHGRVVEVVLGQTSLWCRDEETAKRAVEELVSHVKRLLCNSGMRYATPVRAANLIASDKQALRAFARYVQLDKTKHQGYKPATLAFINAVLQMAFGDPMDGRRVYYVVC
jgi:hypothetical protein